jgi:DNA-binding transcriptional LysR family regulator
MELENIEAIQSLVRNGFGASALPRCAVAGAAGGEALRALTVRGYPAVRQLALATPGAQPQPRPVRALAQMIVARLNSR